MAVNYGGLTANMGPFAPVNLKGNARINGVPTFIKELPLTQGGICGESDGIPYGRVVSIDPTKNRREFVLGVPNTNCIVTGIAALNPTKMRIDPARNDRYMPYDMMDVFRMGLIDICDYDLTKSAPALGSTVWCKNDTGEIAFNDGTDISTNGYTKLNAFVYESLDPNGAKVWFDIPFVATLTRETTSAVATPTATPAAGAVAAGTTVTLATTMPGAAILYTLDGSTPTWTSQRYTEPIAVSAAVTIKAIALADDLHDPSAVLTAAYTIS